MAGRQSTVDNVAATRSDQNEDIDSNAAMKAKMTTETTVSQRYLRRRLGTSTKTKIQAATATALTPTAMATATTTEAAWRLLTATTAQRQRNNSTATAQRQCSDIADSQRLGRALSRMPSRALSESLPPHTRRSDRRSLWPAGQRGGALLLTPNILSLGPAAHTVRAANIRPNLAPPRLAIVRPLPSS